MVTSYDKHLAVRQQCCRVVLASIGHAARCRPSSIRGIVQFRRRETPSGGIVSPVIASGYEHLPIGQQSRGMICACVDRAASVLETNGPGTAGETAGLRSNKEARM